MNTNRLLIGLVVALVVAFLLSSFVYKQFQKASIVKPSDTQPLVVASVPLPLGTRLLVTNLETGLSVEVTINDRGPFVGRRELDLSYGAARAIGMLNAGVTRVLIRPVLS